MKCKEYKKRSSTLSQIANGFTLEKRFETEFKKIAKIGTGGFSSVYKVMNILDNSFYAIKKIKIKMDKKNKDLPKEIVNVLQEIRYLAKIKSEFIVTYNHSWVEVKIKEIDDNVDNYIDYEYNNSADDIEFFDEINKDTQRSKKIYDDFISVNGKVYKIEVIDSINIFIQMELCEETLYDYIEKRNLKNDYYVESLVMFEKILCGVEYIHKENLIHRDLKPKNIFFTFSGEIKIGDLGLATESLNKKCAMECPSPVERSFDISVSEEDLAEELSFHLEMEESKCEETHTSNIGTTQYAAPEQLNNVYYDKKVDIYSLGFILLELVYPFKTRMERQDVHYNLKVKRQISQEFRNKYIDISEILINMTDLDPSKRPDATLLKSQITALIIKLTSPKKLDFKLRKRFLFEDICNIKSYEFNMQFTYNNKWNKVWIKIFDNKLLIYYKQYCDKANLVYDLKDCEVKGTYVEENNSKHLIKRNSSSFGINNYKDDLAYICDSKDNNLHLNYLIEVDHPYQQKLVLKNEYIFETIEFYNKLKKIIN